MRGRHSFRDSQNYHLPWDVTWLRYQVAFIAPLWLALHLSECKAMLMLPQGSIENNAIFVTLQRAYKSTGDLVKMQILMQWVWRGTWDSKYGNKPGGDSHPAGPWATFPGAKLSNSWEGTPHFHPQFIAPRCWLCVRVPYHFFCGPAALGVAVAHMWQLPFVPRREVFLLLPVLLLQPGVQGLGEMCLLRTLLSTPTSSSCLLLCSFSQLSPAIVTHLLPLLWPYVSSVTFPQFFPVLPLPPSPINSFTFFFFVVFDFLLLPFPPLSSLPLLDRHPPGFHSWYAPVVVGIGTCAV